MVAETVRPESVPKHEPRRKVLEFHGLDILLPLDSLALERGTYSCQESPTVVASAPPDPHRQVHLSGIHLAL